MKIHPLLKNLFKQLFNTTFLIFLIISATLWYLNKLSHTYISNITIPVNITNDFNSEQMLIEKTNMLTCQIECKGYKLIGEKLFSKHKRIDIPSSRLRFRNVAGAPYTKVVDNESLKDVLNTMLSPIRLLAIKTGNVYVTSSETVTKKLPVYSSLEVDTRQHYRMISGIELLPDSIIVRGVKPIIDTMSGVWTEKKTFFGVERSISGTVKLEKTDGVTYSTNDIDYNIDIETFTEMEFELPIKITNCPQNLQAKILPYKAKIKLNVNRSNYRFIKPERITLYIDYKDINTNISDKFKIYTSQLPKGVKVMTLAPAYADVVFEKLFNLDTTKNVDKTIKE